MAKGLSIISNSPVDKQKGLSIVNTNPIDRQKGISIVSVNPLDKQKGISLVSDNNLFITICDDNQNEITATITISGGSNIDGTYTNFSFYPFTVGNFVNVTISVSSPGFIPTTITESFNEFSRREIKIELQPDVCTENEISRSFAKLITLPDTTIIPDRGFKECCYTNKVLASSYSVKYEENDFTGFYFKRQLSGDSCDFKLKLLIDDSEVDLNDSTLGIFKALGSIEDNLDLTTFIVQWKKVLQNYGEGSYRIVRSITVAGINFELESNTYVLEEFSQSRAEDTIRIDCSMNGQLIEEGVNFFNSGFTTGLRFKGFFGRRNPTYTQDNLLKRDYSKEQITMSQENEYTLQSNLLPECITEEVYDFILFGDRIIVNDYNGNNHSYKYSEFQVELTGNKGAEYFTAIRDSKINLTFKDRFENKRKINCKD